MKYKHLHITNGSGDKFYWHLQQQTNEKGDILGTGSFHLTELKKRNYYAIFKKAINSWGMCLLCYDIDFKHLEQHHPDPIKMPDFTITLCANCHRDLHWFTGGTNNIRK